jgi:hypothetical protein
MLAFRQGGTKIPSPCHRLRLGEIGAPCGFADFDNNGAVDPDDLSSYIAAYFIGCSF